MNSAPQPKVLVAYYSRTGATRLVARAIAHAWSADLEELDDFVQRRGLRGYVRSWFDAAFERPCRLRPLRHEPGAYDLVIVGTPTWNQSVSAPVRAFLTQQAPRVREVAFFVTYQQQGAQRVLREMCRLSGRQPLATLILREREVRHAPGRALHAFAVNLRDAYRRKRGWVTVAPPAADRRTTPAPD